MNHRHLLLFVLVLGLGIAFTVNFLTADQTSLADLKDPELGASSLRFIKNDGQWEHPFDYKVRLNGGDIYFEKDRMTYSFYNLPASTHGHVHGDEIPHSSDEDVVRGHSFQILFDGGNPRPEVIAGLKYPEYHNYFIGNNPDRWKGKVGLYGLLTYRDIYTDIDMRTYGLGDAIKYDFMVKPGGNPAEIRLKYKGVEKISIKKGELHVKTAVREMVELAPISYQIVDGRKKIIRSEFKLRKDVLTYVFPDGYDPAYELVIDPTLIFSTYTGSTSDNWGFTATYDEDGNGYAGGIQRGAGNGYPTTLGAFQSNFNGGLSDATISKFNATGASLIYSTYLGGTPGSNSTISYEDQPHSMVVDDAGELIVFGRTNSSDFPTTTGVLQGTKSSGYDLFVTKFTDDGTALVASTFVGGSADDGVNGAVSNTNPITFTATKYNYGDDSRGEVTVDASGNIYVAACTFSSNFPTPNGFQTNYGGGQDGCVLKIQPNLSSIIWSSYLGGSSADAAYTLKIDDANNVYVAGGTGSSNFPGSGGWQSSYQGGSTDGFVVKINSNGNAILNRTFVGTSDYDQAYLLELDINNNVYVSGQTEGNFPIIASPSGPVYSNSNSRQFIAKFNNTLSLPIYSTSFGSVGATRPNMSPTAFLVDRCDNVYVAGWGGKTNRYGNVSGMPITSDAQDPVTEDGGSDFYLIVLSRDAQSLLYGSYFGGNNSFHFAGDHVDGGTSRFDKEGVVYHAVCAGCGANSSFPTTPGAYSTTNNSSNCNLALFKIEFNLAGIEAGFTPLDVDKQPLVGIQGCAPLFVNFDNSSVQGIDPTNTTYFWDFGDTNTSTQFEPSNLYQNPGTYQVMLIITDPTSCNIADTTYETITVFPPPSVDAGPDQTVCAGDTITLAALTAGDAYMWTPNGPLITANDVANPSAIVTSTTPFVLTLTDANGCIARDTVVVNVDNSFQVTARPDTVICKGGSVPLSSTSNGGLSYSWFSIPSATINSTNSQNTFASNIDTTTVFYVSSVNAIGCESLDSVRVEVFEVFTLEDTFVCIGNSVRLLSTNGVAFSWSPDDGSLDATNIASPTAMPIVTTTYTVTATSSAGCISTKDVLVEVKPLPTALVSEDATICIGENTRLVASGGVNYAWTPTDGLNDPTVADPLASPTQTTTYSVTVFDEFGCEDMASVLVTVNPLPIVVASDDATICEGESTPLLASGAIMYEWAPATSLSDASIADPIATPSTSTIYIVIGTDANGCQNSDSVDITVVPRPITEIDGINKICVGGSIELTASGGESYIWSTGDTDPTIFVIPDQPTTYYATASVGGCEGFPDSITVDVFFDYPEASFTFTPEFAYAPATITFENTSTGASSYVWEFGFGQGSERENPIHIYPSAGEYSITLLAFSAEGCPDTLTQNIRIDNVTLHVPSGFTPNDDNFNNNFFVGYVGIKTMKVQIFSRWGPLIYESDNPDFQWDGRYKGVPVPEGVYVYVIEGIGENDLKYERVGTVTILR